MPSYQDIPQYTRGASYAVDISWRWLPQHYHHSVVDYGLDVNPNFQRGRVWSTTQKVNYIEYILQGGKSGKDLYFNCPKWHYGRIGRDIPGGWYVLVDGKQRIDAVLGYLSNEFKIFGQWYHEDYTSFPDIMTASFRWYVNELQTIEEVYRWYIDLNSGGTVHSPDEIARVQALLDAKVPYSPISGAEAEEAANMSRSVIVAVKEEQERNKAEKDARDAANAAKPKKKRR